MGEANVRAAPDGAPTIIEYRPTGQVPPRLTPQREQALERIENRQGLVRELATIADVSDAVIRGLVKVGAIEPIEVRVDDPYPEPDPITPSRRSAPNRPRPPPRS